MTKIKKTEEEIANIVAKVRHTGRMANTLAKALAQRYAHRWQFVDFLGPNGQESAGIVDILAIRKSSAKPLIDGLKSLDAFDIILIQVKGGSAKRPATDDIYRLRLVGARYHALAVVLFEWSKERKVSQFLELESSDSSTDDPWRKTTAAKLFGKTFKSAADKEL